MDSGKKPKDGDIFRATGTFRGDGLGKNMTQEANNFIKIARLKW